MESDENETPLSPAPGKTMSAGDKGSSKKSSELDTCGSNVVKRPVRLTALGIFLEKRMSRLHNAVDQNVQVSASKDSWLQAGFVLATGINSAYVQGYSGALMVPL